MGIFKDILDRFVNDTRIWQKFIFAFGSVVLIPMCILAYISFTVMDRRLADEASEKVEAALNTVWVQYYVRGNQMRYGMMQAAVMDNIKAAVRRGDSDYLNETIRAWKQGRPYVDLWEVVGPDGRVMAALGAPDLREESASPGLVKRALSVKKALVSTELVADPEKTGAESIVLTVVTPILDNNKVLGAIVTGDVLNHDLFLPDMVSLTMRDVVISVNQGAEVVTTNLTDDGGSPVLGRFFPEDTLESLAREGSVRGDLELLGSGYVAAVDPIKDGDGNLIGSVFVGMPRSALWAVKKENALIIGAVSLFGMAFAFVIALISTYKYSRPLTILTEKNEAFAAGDTSVRMPEEMTLGKRDEISVLSRAFNTMMGEVQRRGEVAERYLLEIKNKNTRLTELNEEVTVIKDRLRLIYDGIPDYIFLYDTNYDLIEANKAFLDDYGLKAEDVIGTKCYKTVCKQEQFPDDCLIKKARESKRPESVDRVGLDGRLFQTKIFPQLDSKGEVVRFVEHRRDVTEETRLKEQLIRTDKLSSLGELVSGVAHELNNPLTGIIGFSELLLTDVEDEKTQKKLETIYNEAMRCKRIIRNLLTFARSHKPEKDFHDMNQLISDVMELRSYQLKTDNIEIVMALAEGLPALMIDPHQIEQVLLNLINNAQQAMTATSSSLNDEDDAEDDEDDDSGYTGPAGTLTIATRGGGDSVSVLVTDTGGGIPDDVSRKIFDPFFTTKDVGKGTGLGLSISYGIVNEHGGNISFEKAPGGGTTFVMELPLQQEAVGEMQGALKKGRIKDRVSSLQVGDDNDGQRALVLDDEETVREVLKNHLARLGVSTDATSSGEAALKMLKEKNYNLIISDIKMPGMDGKRFHAEVVSESPELAERIVFITGDTTSSDISNFADEVGCRFLQKPFTFAGLKDAVEEFLG